MHETPPPPHPKSKLELESCEQTGLIGFIFIFLFCDQHCSQTGHYSMNVQNILFDVISRLGIQ